MTREDHFVVPTRGHKPLEKPGNDLAWEQFTREAKVRQRRKESREHPRSCRVLAGGCNARAPMGTLDSHLEEVLEKNFLTGVDCVASTNSVVDAKGDCLKYAPVYTLTRVGKFFLCLNRCAHTWHDGSSIARSSTFGSASREKYPREYRLVLLPPSSK